MERTTDLTSAATAGATDPLRELLARPVGRRWLLKIAGGAALGLAGAGGTWVPTASVEEIAMEHRSLLTPEEAQAYFWHVMDFNLFPMYTWQYSGETTSANDAFLDLLGFTRAEYEAHGINWRERTSPDYLPQDTDAEAKLQRTPAYSHEKEFIRKDGTRVRVRIYDGTRPGEPTKGVGIAWPIAK
jgi:PAS domain S-box-containing protein